MTAQRRPERSGTVRRSQAVANVVTWILLVFWTLLLFAPTGPAIPFLRLAYGNAQAYYIRQFRWDLVRRGTTTLAGSPTPAESPTAVDLVAFSDYECPFCRQAEPVLDSLRQKYPAAAVGYRHVARPSSSRSHASALAAICAQRLGTLSSIHDTLFSLTSRPDSLFPRELEEAMHSLVPGPAGNILLACIRGPTSDVLRRLAFDSVLTARLRLRGTPTFLGRHGSVTGVPTVEELVRAAGLGTP
jgi:hypothetical protein